MRLIRLTLKPTVRAYLAQLSKQHGLDDNDIAEDIFALFRQKGAGLPTDERIDALASALSAKAKASKLLTSIHLKKRRQMLRSLSETTYFKSLAVAEAARPHKAVARLLVTIDTFSRKRRQAACMSCNLKAACAFGQQYGAHVTNITQVYDSAHATKVHAQCPDKPSIDSFNRMAEEMQKMAGLTSETSEGLSAAAATPGGHQFLSEEEKAASQLGENGEFDDDEDASEDAEDEDADEDDPDSIEASDEDNLDDTGRVVGGGSYDPSARNRLSFTGGQFASTNEDFVNKLSVSALQLFELGRVLEGMLAKEIKGKFAPTNTFAADKKTKQLETLSEITSANLSEHASDDLLDARIAKQEVVVTKHQKPDTSRSCLYVLIDCSGSMHAQTCDGNPHMLLTRNQIAASFTAALIRRVVNDGGVVRFRYFSDHPMSLYSAEDKQSADYLSKLVCRCDASGGGTSIFNALFQAVRDVTNSKTQKSIFAKAEVLLISDMDDNITPKQEAELFSRYGDGKTKPKLNVFDINASTRKFGNAHNVLKKNATKYFCVSPTGLDLGKLVDLAK